MPEIFLSYTHEDAPAAGRIEKALRDLGVEVWIDNRLQTGARFTDHIHQQIDAAGAVIVCWSKKAVESPWVQAEALFALDRGKLTPVLIGKCELRPPFNAVNASNLIDWRGEARHAGWQRLLLALEKALDGVKLADRALVDELRVSGADVATPEAARRRRTLRAAIIAGVAVPAAAAAGVVGYSLWDTRSEIAEKFEEDQGRRREEQEAEARREAAQSAWNTAKDLGTRTAIESFIEQNGDSPHLREARQVLAEIEAREVLAMNAADRAAAELRAWQAAERADTIEAYQNFKTAYGWSRRVRDADAAISRLQVAAAEAADSAAWVAAQRTNTVASYQAYLRGADDRNYPGAHRSSAEARIVDLRANASRAADNAAWARAAGAPRSGAIGAYRNYIDWARENGGAYVDEANAAIQLIEREDNLIAVARDERTSSAFERYLRDFPQGHYADEARSARDMHRRREVEAAEDRDAFEEARRLNTRVALRDYWQRPSAAHRTQADELIARLNRADDDAWSLAERERDPQRRRERIREYLRVYETDRYARHVAEAERELRRLDAQPPDTTTSGGAGATRPTGATGATTTTTGGGTGAARPTGATGATTTTTGGVQTGGARPSEATPPVGQPSGGDGAAPAGEQRPQDADADPSGGRQRDPD